LLSSKGLQSEDSMLYYGYQAQADLMSPLYELAGQCGGAWLAAPKPWRNVAAACEVLALARLLHRRPEFGISSVTQDGREVDVTEQAAARTPFCTLLHFRKDVADPGPRVLLVAPMSGHFSTLLRETVRTLLGDHDVYLTDWHSARDIALSEGRFGVDEYTEHLVRFLGVIGPGAHLMAVCQPCVEAFAATALMAEDGDPATPASLTLMAGPIDCRVNPTAVNRLANEKPIEWFERNLISVVPHRLAGAGRDVYPGFIQLSAFLNMNLERHKNMFKAYYEDLVEGNTERAATTRDFYHEYFAVADLPAEFYLETVKRVFQDHDLPRGLWTCQGRPLRPQAIRRTALITVEGERDDICALGQTMAAHELCPTLPPHLRMHYVQPGVGHYGVFSGRNWSQKIYPLVRNAIRAAD
jgi:polyhydroxyalkanoate depolymerase